MEAAVSKPSPYIGLTRDTLTDLDNWSMRPSAWEQIDRLLDQLSTALEAEDMDAVGLLNSELMLYAPRRVSDPDVGEEDTTPPPETTKDQRNQLVHRIDVGWPELPTSSDDD